MKLIECLIDGYKNYEPISTLVEKLPKRTKISISNKAASLGLTKEYIKNNNASFKADYNDYDWCYERFINRCMSTDEIAKESGYSKRVIEKWIYEKIQNFPII